MSHFEDLRKHKELINLRESARYSWREELSEGKDEHPYVDVMPNEKTGEEKPKKKEKKEEEVKEAYYGGEEQRKKDEKKAEYEKQLKKMLPKRAFDSTGAELDPRSGKRLKEGFKLTPNTQFREGLSIDDQMRISREHNRKSKEEKLAANKAALGAVKKVAQKKDERTDAQKMADATDSRPGSFYRNMKR